MVVDVAITRLAVPLSITYSVEGTMKVAFTVGRFQPPTTGHKVLIDQTVAAGDKAYVFVSNVSGAKNPLTAKQKIVFLNKMFKSDVVSGKLEFIDTQDCQGMAPCGGPPLAYAWVRSKHPDAEFVLVAGSDRTPTFGPTAKMWSSLKDMKPPAFIGIKREEGDMTNSLDPRLMSGTKARKFVTNNDMASFTSAVKFGAMEDADVAALFKLLKASKNLSGGGDEDIAWFADAETKGGRRKTYRTCRKCGLPVKR